MTFNGGPTGLGLPPPPRELRPAARKETETCTDTATNDAYGTVDDRRWLALAVIVSIQTGLHLSEEDLQWTT